MEKLTKISRFGGKEYRGYWLGKKRSEGTKRKIRKTLKKKKFWLGEKNPNWKGGESIRYRRKHESRPQPLQCEICGAFVGGIKRGICYDHDHKTGKFRGWICLRCNSALGLVKENIETLEAMIKYLKRSVKTN